METSHAHIMVVDDVAENLQVLGNILHKEGFNISFAQDGRQALEIISEVLPDLVLLDISMPEMDGFEVCDILKKNDITKSIPVIFLTARTETESMVHGFNLGAVDYITKPFNPQELLARVKAHLEIKFSRDIIHQQNEKLKEMNTTKDKFFSIIAHDLRNPFTVLLSSCELLLLFLEKNDIEKVKLNAIRMLNSSKRGFLLLQNLLEWAQSQLGNTKFTPVNLMLKNLVSETSQFIENYANNKEIKIQNEVPDALQITADIALLQFVIRNLLTNAIKFTSKGGIVTIKASTNEYLTEISIFDTGIGMAKETQDKLFRIDTKVSSNGTNGETGTGLGLILCKEFVEKHGGNIFVESELGKGSVFKFTIPVSILFDNRGVII
jgi:signal transduction histidine kinase